MEQKRKNETEILIECKDREKKMLAWIERKKERKKNGKRRKKRIMDNENMREYFSLDRKKEKKRRKTK